MGWLFGIIIVLVIAAAAYAGSGKLGSMPEQVVDRPGPDLPDGDLNAQDLADVRFDVVSRGYDPQQVEAVLDRLAGQLSDAESSMNASGAAALTHAQANNSVTGEQSELTDKVNRPGAPESQLESEPVTEASDQGELPATSLDAQLPLGDEPLVDAELTAPAEADEDDDLQLTSTTEIDAAESSNGIARRAE